MVITLGCRPRKASSILARGIFLMENRKEIYNMDNYSELRERINMGKRIKDLGKGYPNILNYEFYKEKIIHEETSD